MARLLSSVLKEAMFGERTAEGLALLLTIAHEGEPVPIRVTPVPGGLTSRGDPFSFYPFDIALPDDEEDKTTVASFVGDNVSRLVIAWLRKLPSAPSGTIEVVKLSDPDTVELRVPKLLFLEPTTPDSLTITCDLQVPDFSQQRYPKHRYIPSNYPALSRAAS